MFEITMSFDLPGKYYISVEGACNSFCYVTFSQRGEVENYSIFLRKKKNIYILKSNGAVKIKFTHEEEISIKKEHRKSSKNIPFIFNDLFCKLFNSFGFSSENLKTKNGHILKSLDYFASSKFQGELSPVAFCGNFAMKRTTAEQFFAFLRSARSQDVNVAEDLAAKYDMVPDDGFIFLINYQMLPSDLSGVIGVWSREHFGDPVEQSGPAWDILRKNNGIGAVYAKKILNKIDCQWKNGGRLEKFVSSFGLSYENIKNESSLPAVMLIRKSALDWLKALNFTSSDFSNGLINKDIFPWVVFPMIQNSGFIVSDIPKITVSYHSSEPVDKFPLKMVRHLPDIKDCDICLFVGLLDHKGEFSKNALNYMFLLKESGIIVHALGVALGDLADAKDPGTLFSDAFSVRANGGYDFAIWAASIIQCQELKDAKSLFLINDSVFVSNVLFNEFLQRLKKSDFDVTGSTGCWIENFHLQSYFLHFNRKSLQSDVFWTFWDKVVVLHDKFHIISAYEVGLTTKLASGGLRCGSLYQPIKGVNNRKVNPTIHLWKELIELGMPFVKVQLLRDNPSECDLSGWASFLDMHGFDTSFIVSELKEKSPSAVALRRVTDASVSSQK
jgi:hypothetical protein